METSGHRKQGDIDTAFADAGTFNLVVDGFGSIDPGGSEKLRALGRVHDGNLLLAMGCRNLSGPSWQYGLARLTPNGALDPSFGNKGIVIGALPPELGYSAAQAWATHDRAIVVVLRDQTSQSWVLARHDVDGALDPAFGTFGYVNLQTIRPDNEPHVVKGFIIPGPGHAFFFIGTTKNANGRYVGGIVFRFTALGQLDHAFAQRGYALFDVPLGTSGRITDAVVQDDGKIVLSMATAAGTSHIVRLLPSGNLDTGFGTEGHFVVRGNTSSDIVQVEKLVWSAAGIFALGHISDESPRIGLLVALDDRGVVAPSFNEGKPLEIRYGKNGDDEPNPGSGGLSSPLSIAVDSQGRVTVVGHADYDNNDIKRVIVGRHLSSGELDPSYGDGDGFYTIDFSLVGFNFIFFGADVTDDRLTFEILSGDGGGGSNPDRVLVQRFFA